MQRNHIIISLLLILLTFSLIACGEEDESGSSDNRPQFAAESAEGKGQEIFQANCATCHAVEGDRVIVGPSFEGLATRAENRVEGLTATEYLRESITNPNAYIVDGFNEDSMPQNFALDLSSDELNNLISYLLTLK